MMKVKVHVNIFKASKTFESTYETCNETFKLVLFQNFHQEKKNLLDTLLYIDNIEDWLSTQYHISAPLTLIYWIMNYWNMNFKKYIFFLDQTGCQMNIYINIKHTVTQIHLNTTEIQHDRISINVWPNCDYILLKHW